MSYPKLPVSFFSPCWPKDDDNIHHSDGNTTYQTTAFIASFVFIVFSQAYFITQLEFCFVLLLISIRYQDWFTHSTDNARYVWLCFLSSHMFMWLLEFGVSCINHRKTPRPRPHFWPAGSPSVNPSSVFPLNILLCTCPLPNYVYFVGHQRTQRFCSFFQCERSTFQ